MNEVTDMNDIKSMTMEEMEEMILSMGEKKFRAGQIYKWLHKELADDYDAMSDLSKKLREELAAARPLYGVREIRRLESAKDGTVKYLFALHDDNVIESVLMRYKHGNSVCISSQVGCNMGCKFCASTVDGCVRSLTPSEMLSQVYAIQKDCGERISNVVVMGSGEPLDNYEALLRFIKMITDENGLNISQRNITVSTCGLVPKIRSLADEKLQITLAISLHAPNDEKRKALMPVAKVYSIDELMEACRYYFDSTGRRVTFEYALVAGNNDGEEDAMQLCALLKGMGAHVNLIPVNPVTESGMKRPEMKNCERFRDRLIKGHVNATIRRELGSDVNAACGQLRRSHLNN